MSFNFNRGSFANSGQPVLRRDVLQASATLDFPEVAAAASTTLTIAAPGADLTDGDVVQIFPSVPVAGLVYTAWVSADDEITVRVTNVTAGAINATSSVHRAVVWKAF